MKGFEYTAFIPTYNSQRTVATTIKSVALQNKKAKKTIVIDSGGKDSTCELAATLGCDVYGPKHWGLDFLGLAKARNRILEFADTEFLFSADSDVELPNDYVAKISDEFEKHPNASGIGGKLVDLHRTFVGDAFRATVVMRDLITPLCAKQEKWVDWLSGSQNIYRVENLKRVGELENSNPCRPFDENLSTNYEDIDIGLKLNKHGYKLYYNPKILAYHHQRDSADGAIDRWYRYHIDKHLKDDAFGSVENYMGTRVPYLKALFEEAIATAINKRRYALIPLIFKSQEYFLSKDAQKLPILKDIDVSFINVSDMPQARIYEDRLAHLENSSPDKIIIDFADAPESDSEFITLKPVFERYNVDELRFELKGLNPKVWEIRGVPNTDFIDVIRLLEGGEL